MEERIPERASFIMARELIAKIEDAEKTSATVEEISKIVSVGLADVIHYYLLLITQYAKNESGEFEPVAKKIFKDICPRWLSFCGDINTYGKNKYGNDLVKISALADAFNHILTRLGV